MAGSYRVELESPDGETYISHSAVDTNNLVYGQGYRIKENKPATDAPPVPARPAPTPDATKTGGQSA
jgi:hypothetical protein